MTSLATTGPIGPAKLEAKNDDGTRLPIGTSILLALLHIGVFVVTVYLSCLQNLRRWASIYWQIAVCPSSAHSKIEHKMPSPVLSSGRSRSADQATATMASADGRISWPPPHAANDRSIGNPDNSLAAVGCSFCASFGRSSSEHRHKSEDATNDRPTARFLVGTDTIPLGRVGVISCRLARATRSRV